MNKHILRSIKVLTVIAILFGLAGAVSVPAQVKESSYIVQAQNYNTAAALVKQHGGEITTSLEIINAVAANLSDAEVAALRLEKSITAITLNRAVTGSDEGTHTNIRKKDEKGIPSTDYPNVTGSNLVWAEDVTGEGIAVAVVDTGIARLPQLDKNTENKSRRIVGWADFIGKSKNPVDPNGHGTHVAGIIANSQQGNDNEWNGIAPDVNLVGVRVLDETGYGTYESVISGLQWVIKNKDKYNIRVVNLSLVSPVQSPYWADPLDQAVTAAWANGLTVVAAAGNTGPGAMSITVPGNNPYVITVGAFTDNYTPADWNDDYITPFSAAGPTLDGFIKPDVVAPGAHMVSLIKEDSYLTGQYPDNTLKAGYFQLAGTSQATGVVSGIAALVIAKHPELTNDQVKMRLMSTAIPWGDDEVAGYSMWQQGAGRVNAYDAVFTDESGPANEGMDVQADLAGTQHYEGFSYYDEASGTFKLREPYGDFENGYGTWDGRYGSWSGRYGSWSGRYGSWSGRYGSWSGTFAWIGRYGSWSGRYGSWSGRYGSWSGRYGSWSGGYTSWAGRYGSWSGTEPWSGSQLADTTFAASFAAGNSPSAASTTATISNFLLEP